MFLFLKAENEMELIQSTNTYTWNGKSKNVLTSYTSIYSGHYTTSVNCCNRTFYCNDNKITEFDMINTKNSSTAYVVIYKLIT